MMNFPRRTLPLALVAALAGGSSAEAVELAPGGLGQVLLFPYYTVDAGSQTLVSIVNTTADTKALRFRSRESRNGREALSFNMYLGPYDVWTAAIFSIDANGSANLATSDTSCTAPPIRNNTSLPLIGDTRYAPFRNFAYAGDRDDAGILSLTRTREGSLEVIEMGTLAAGTPSASAARATTAEGPSSCSTLSQAWVQGGYWSANPNQDMGNPTGGLFGTALVVDVADGTAFQVAATALDHFRDGRGLPAGNRTRVIHTAPGVARPDLRDALTTPGDGTVVASIGGENYVYPTERAVDAVSAVLASAKVANEYLASADVGAATDWVVNWPTKAYYTDPEIVGANVVAPFAKRFDNANPDGCEVVRFQPFNRNQTSPDCGAAGVCAIDLCGVTSVIGLDNAGERTGALGSDVGLNEDLPYDAGFGVLSWTGPEVGARRLRPDRDGRVIEGLPVIGFAATRAVNANAQPGTLANYTVTQPHRQTRAGCVAGPCTPGTAADPE